MAHVENATARPHSPPPLWHTVKYIMLHSSGPRGTVIVGNIRAGAETPGLLGILEHGSKWTNDAGYTIQNTELVCISVFLYIFIYISICAPH